MEFITNPVGAIGALLYDLLRSFLPDWAATGLLALIGSAVLVGIISVIVMLLVWLERKIIARMQDRLGPNRVGPFGLLQSVADAVKLLSKEDVIPARVDRPLFILAPIKIGRASCRERV